MTGVTISNGIDWSPDESLAYYIDSTTRRVDQFDYNPLHGELSGRRPFVVIEDGAGLPDGLTVDTDGGVWVALSGGGQVRRYTPEAQLDCVIELPSAELVTSCCFGGPGLDHLYISTSTEGLTARQRSQQPGAGFIFGVSPGYRGKPSTSFPTQRTGGTTP